MSIRDNNCVTLFIQIMNLEKMTQRKKNSVQLHGTQERYDRHLRAQKISDAVNEKDYHIYTDSLKERILRNES